MILVKERDSLIPGGTVAHMISPTHSMPLSLRGRGGRGRGRGKPIPRGRGQKTKGPSRRNSIETVVASKIANAIDSKVDAKNRKDDSNALTQSYDFAKEELEREGLREEEREMLTEEERIRRERNEEVLRRIEEDLKNVEGERDERGKAEKERERMKREEEESKKREQEKEEEERRKKEKPQEPVRRGSRSPGYCHHFFFSPLHHISLR